MEKYVCIRDCYQPNENGKSKLFHAGDVTWREKDPGRHWSKMPVGEPMSAVQALGKMCTEIGIKVEKEWDIGRLQREYDQRMLAIHAEQDKTVMGKSMRETDARVTNAPPDYKKGK